MTHYKKGDVVLVLFKQSNNEEKKRPALIVLDIEDNDVVLVPITTTERTNKGDLKILKWKEAGLVAESWMRLAKVTTLNKTMITKLLGTLENSDKENFVQGWNEVYKFD